MHCCWSGRMAATLSACCIPLKAPKQIAPHSLIEMRECGAMPLVRQKSLRDDYQQNGPCLVSQTTTCNSADDISVFKEFERLASSRSVAGRLRGRLFFVEEVEAEVGFVFGAIDLERNFSACAMLVEEWIDRLQQN